MHAQDVDACCTAKRKKALKPLPLTSDIEQCVTKASYRWRRLYTDLLEKSLEMYGRQSRAQVLLPLVLKTCAWLPVNPYLHGNGE